MKRDLQRERETYILKENERHTDKNKKRDTYIQREREREMQTKRE
jgi:hypothetical protein